ncbi:glycosyl transferase family 2 [Bacillus sp. FJAT-18019]|nr:glycosyl transferase family 2 [Bacillus sp. FJAT-18019]
MTSYAILRTQPFGYRVTDAAAYREQVLLEVSHIEREWVLWNCNRLFAHIGARISVAMPKPIPDHIVCICMNGVPLYWRTSWLLPILAFWNDRLPAVRFLPYDLLPADPNLILHMNSTPDHSNQHELNYIRPILSASRSRETTGGSNTMLPCDVEPPPQPALSILMSIHNMKDTVGWSIRSVLGQSMDNWELLIGDDASEDESLEEVCAYGDSRIRILSQPRNRGKAIMMNQLLSEARGRYILELDGDDWLAPDASALLTKALDTNPDRALATGWYGWWERTRQYGPLWRRDMDSGKLFFEYSSSVKLSKDRGQPIIPRMYRKSSLITIGGWRNREDHLGRVFEDIDVTSRLLKHSSPVSVDTVLYHRVIHRSSISQRNRNLFDVWYRHFN